MSTDIDRERLAMEYAATASVREIGSSEARARRTAKRVGWAARKTRWRAGSIDNLGGFAIIDPFTNNIVYGERFDLTAEDVIEICTPEPED